MNCKTSLPNLRMLPMDLMDVYRTKMTLILTIQVNKLSIYLRFIDLVLGNKDFFRGKIFHSTMVPKTKQLMKTNTISTHLHRQILTNITSRQMMNLTIGTCQDRKRIQVVSVESLNLIRDLITNIICNSFVILKSWISKLGYVNVR